MQMKAKYIKYFSMAVLPLLMGACIEEQIEKAPYDSEDCMGVYFVEDQENVKSHTLEKGKDESFLEFKVRRVNSDKAVEVPNEYSVYRIVQTQDPGDTAYESSCHRL